MVGARCRRRPPRGPAAGIPGHTRAGRVDAIARRDDDARRQSHRAGGEPGAAPEPIRAAATQPPSGRENGLIADLSGPSGSIECVTLVLLYLVVLILVAVVLFGLGSVLFGRGEPLPPLPTATTATVLPASGVTGSDVDSLKFTQTLRGYKTSEVDWVLDRLGQELDQLRGQLAKIGRASCREG